MIEIEKSTPDLSPPETEGTAEVSPAGAASLNLQSPDRPREAETYELEELLRYHDREFVLNLYSAIFKRAPKDDELVATLDDLRSGRRTKIEIVEDLLATRPSAIKVAGLSSPRLRAISRWPIIGYWIRLFVSLNRLPVLIRHQQQFEAHALGQQQKIADYLNEVVPAAIKRDQSSAVDSLASVVNDAVDGVTMLSDSLIDLSARQVEMQAAFQQHLEQLQADTVRQGRRLAETQTKMQDDLLAHLRQLQDQQARHAKTETQLQADIKTIADHQAAQQQALDDTQRGFREIQQTLQQIQHGFEETQRVSQQAGQTAQQIQHDLQQTQTGAVRLQSDVEQAQSALRQIQIMIDEMQRAQSATADAQQEFLIQEQRVIVETQKAILADLQTQLDEFRHEQTGTNEQLLAELNRLNGLSGSPSGDAAGATRKRQRSKA